MIDNSFADDVALLASRVERARERLALQHDPALTEVLSDDELVAERELAERIRTEDRDQRWKQVQALVTIADRARRTSAAIEKTDMRELLTARKAVAAQRRESSPHARLASLYRHRSWSQRGLASVVVAAMLWSAVNVQHNIAPGGANDPLYWFSYLLEAMISVCLIIMMIGTNKVAEWGVLDSRRQVVVAELTLLALTVILNAYPYVRAERWFDTGVHAVAPTMIGVALLIHNAASTRYSRAITSATEQIRELPDPPPLNDPAQPPSHTDEGLPVFQWNTGALYSNGISVRSDPSEAQARSTTTEREVTASGGDAAAGAHPIPTPEEIVRIAPGPEDQREIYDKRRTRLPTLDLEEAGGADQVAEGGRTVCLSKHRNAKLPSSTQRLTEPPHRRTSDVPQPATAGLRLVHPQRRLVPQATIHPTAPNSDIPARHVTWTGYPAESGSVAFAAEPTTTEWSDIAEAMCGSGNGRDPAQVCEILQRTFQRDEQLPAIAAAVGCSAATVERIVDDAAPYITAMG